MSKQTLDELNAVAKLIHDGERDPGQMHAVAHVKRFLEWFIGDPAFRLAYEQAPQAAIDRYGLDVTAADMDCLCRQPFDSLPRAGRELPPAVHYYAAYVREKLDRRGQLQAAGCVPSQPAFKAWRQRQLNRCWGELGSNNAGFIHVPLVFELSQGCSVGCAFCALAAAKLTGVFRATAANRRLWRDILLSAKRLIGDAAGSGVCYCATEPFDNPDYEVFSRIYQECFGVVPQVTTAAAMRQPERTRRFLRAAARQPGVHRFSILTLQAYREVCRCFTPEELLYVELLPRFPEAAAYNQVTQAGRARQGNTDAEETVAQTISCASGFIVNMVEKSIRLTTPCNADAAHPTGEIQYGRRSFRDSADFAAQLTGMIETYMPRRLDHNRILRFQSFYHYASSPTGFVLTSKAKFRVEFTFSLADRGPVYEKIGDLIRQEKWTARQIAATLAAEYDLPPAEIFHGIHYLYKSGCLTE